MSKAWIRNDRNSILEADGFHISFNPNTDQGAETAIVQDERPCYLILLGDHREEYEGLVDQGWEACAMYFYANREEASPWSESYEPKEVAKLEAGV